MLVLKRRPGEGLSITGPDGTQVRFKVLKGYRVAVGAPSDWVITRDAIEALPTDGGAAGPTAAERRAALTPSLRSAPPLSGGAA